VILIQIKMATEISLLCSQSDSGCATASRHTALKLRSSSNNNNDFFSRPFFTAQDGLVSSLGMLEIEQNGGAATVIKT
jgi:hypothetical protein